MTENHFLSAALWLASSACGALGFTYAKPIETDVLTKLVRVAFGVLLMMAVWSTTVFTLWSFGIDLDVGAVKDGKMQENWWLPIVCTAMAYSAFKILKPRK